MSADAWSPSESVTIKVKLFSPSERVTDVLHRVVPFTVNPGDVTLETERFGAAEDVPVITRADSVTVWFVGVVIVIMGDAPSQDTVMDVSAVSPEESWIVKVR